MVSEVLNFNFSTNVALAYNGSGIAEGGALNH